MKDHTNKIISTIDAYLEIDGVEENDLGLLIQLDFDDDQNQFTVDYTLTTTKDDPMEIDTGFIYENLPEAWENYLDQITEIHQKYNEAEIRNAHPEAYKGGKLGGNPVMSIRDADGGF